MALPAKHITTQGNTSAIFFALMVSLGLCLTPAALAGALFMTFGAKVSIPQGKVLLLVIVLLIVLLTLVFFIAAYITARMAHQQHLFDAIVHSLTTWALMAILLVLLLSAASLTASLHKSVGAISLKGASLVTNVQILKGKAITTFEHLGPKLGPQKPTPEDKKHAELLRFAWWICFFSLISGFAASIAGALLGHRPH